MLNRVQLFLHGLQPSSLLCVMGQLPPNKTRFHRQEGSVPALSLLQTGPPWEDWARHCIILGCLGHFVRHIPAEVNASSERGSVLLAAGRCFGSLTLLCMFQQRSPQSFLAKNISHFLTTWQVAYHPLNTSRLVRGNPETLEKVVKELLNRGGFA